jgi:hypothetical protein
MTFKRAHALKISGLYQRALKLIALENMFSKQVVDTFSNSGLMIKV